jgi:hypothetical protein
MNLSFYMFFDCACNKTNLMHYLSLVYYVTVGCWRAWMDPGSATKTYKHVTTVTYIHCYLLMMGY